jgi:hypothetical protein
MLKQYQFATVRSDSNLSDENYFLKQNLLRFVTSPHIRMRDGLGHRGTFLVVFIFRPFTLTSCRHHIRFPIIELLANTTFVHASAMEISVSSKIISGSS